MASTAENGDTIIPVHETDNQAYYKAIILDVTLRFDEILDANRLKAGLERLLEIGEWRKLGARIHRRADGIDEFQIPGEFTDKRPGFAFSHVTHDVAIADHPVGRKVPQATSTPQTFAPMEDFAQVIVSTDAPTRWKHWTNTDRPLLSFFIVHFLDATLVSFRWPHLFMDAMGFKQMLEAWTLVLNHHEDRVPAIVGFTQDPYAYIPASKTLAQTHLLNPILLKGTRFYLWLLMLIKELVLHPKAENRIICLPSTLTSRLITSARQECTPSDPYITDSDILYAFWAKLFVRAASTSPSRPITMANVANLRGRLGDALPNEKAYVGNAISLIVTQMSARELLSSSLAQVALKLRAATQAQLTKDQCEAMIAVAKTSKIGMYGPWNEILIMLTNWHKSRFFEVELLEGVSGKPSFVGERFSYEGIPAMRNTGTVVGRDGQGNWWFRMTLRKGFWEQVEGYLKEENER